MYKENDNSDHTGNSVLPAKVQRSVMNIMKKEGYKNPRINSKLTYTPGGNYLSVLYEVDVEGETDDGDKETNIFIKHTIPVENAKILALNEAYASEAFFYNQLCDVYTQLQNEANIPSEERYFTAGSFDESDSETIILDNLSRKGFRILHRMDVISLEFAQISLKQLAKFHALSFVLEKKRPQFFEENIKKMSIAWRFNEYWEQFVANVGKLAMSVVDEDAKRKMEKFVPTLYHPENFYNNNGIKCCLCHGDYKLNNILYLESNDKISRVIPVDYQLLHYGCPVTDFIFFTMLSTDQQTRRQHLNHFKDLYHDTLGEFLQYFGLKSEEIYPREEFEKTFKERLNYGLLMMMMALPFMFASSEAPEFGDPDKCDFNLDPKFAERIRGLVEDYIYWESI